MSAPVVKQQYNMMDVVKFLSAILLVCAHTASERVNLPGILDLACSLYIVTVPFFFVASSFLFFKKLNKCGEEEQKSAYRKYTKRIGMMYLAWSLIYFCFVATTWVQTDAGSDVILSYFHSCLVYTTYPTIWFLPALWIAVSLVYLMRYRLKWSMGCVFVVALVLYVLGAVEYSYHSLSHITDSINDSYVAIMKSWRNGLFNGFIYACIGCIIANGDGKLNLAKSIAGTCVFGVAFLAEAFLMKRIVPSADANFLLMLVPFSYFFFDLVCRIQLPDSKIYVPLRKMSMLIFVSQRLFLTAIPSVIVARSVTGPWDLTNNGCLALLLVLCEVIVFSYMIIALSTKVKILKYLM